MHIIKSEEEFQVGKAYLCWTNGTPVINIITGKDQYCYLKNGGLYTNNGSLPSSWFYYGFMAVEMEENEFWEFMKRAFKTIERKYRKSLDVAEHLSSDVAEHLSSLGEQIN